MPRRPMPLVSYRTVESPDVFSFGKHLSFNPYLRFIVEEFENMTPYLNNSVNDGRDVLGDGRSAIDLLQGYIRQATQIHPLDYILLARLKTAHYILCVNKLLRNDPFYNRDHLTQLWQQLKTEFSKVPTVNDEVAWYFAVINFFNYLANGSISRENIDSWLRVLRYPMAKSYKKSIQSWFLRDDVARQHLSLQDAYELNRVFENDVVDHVPLAVRSRHELIMSQFIINKQYFSSELLVFSDHVVIVTPLFWGNDNHVLSISKLSLKKFVAHIYQHSHPIVKITIPGLSMYHQKKFNDEFYKVMRAQKHGDSVRGLKVNVFKKTKPAQLRDLFTRILGNIGVFEYASDQQKYRNTVENINFDDFSDRFDQMEKYAEQLDAFNYLDALHFFYLCLVAHHSLVLQSLQRIKAVVSDCLRTAHLAQCIQNKNINDAKKHEETFLLAQSVVDDFWRHKKCKIVSVGTPIVPSKADHSRHVFYVGLQPVLINGIFQFRVIICNAGDGVDVFHRLATYGIPQHNEEHDYAAFKPLHFDEQGKNFLQHYIYRVLITRFTIVYEEKIESGDLPGTFNNIMRHVYLRTKNDKKEASFLGYKFKKINHDREDLDVGVEDQRRGNCTVYNLKKLIKILFSMDEQEYGELENTLILGVDQFIEQNPLLK